MISFKHDSKDYIEIKTDDFTFEQFEIASELLAKFQEIAMEVRHEATTDEEQAGLSMFQLINKAKMQRPLIALLFKEKGTEFSKETYEQNIELFAKLKMSIYEKVRAVVVNFLTFGQQYILRNSLIYLQNPTDMEIASASSENGS